MVTGVKTETGETEEKKSQLRREKSDNFYGAGPQIYC